MTADIERLHRALKHFLAEFTDAHDVPTAAVVGTLHVVAYEILRQNDDTDLENFNHEVN